MHIDVYVYCIYLYVKQLLFCQVKVQEYTLTTHNILVSFFSPSEGTAGAVGLGRVLWVHCIMHTGKHLVLIVITVQLKMFCCYNKHV